MMRRAPLALLLPLAAACAKGDRGVPDDRLAGLVVETRPADTRVNLDKAVLDPVELNRALTLPFAATLAKLGPVSVSIDTRTVVTEGGTQVSDLADQTTLELGELAGGAYRAVYNNTADYGRETIFTGGTLYLRPRYQAWNARPPEAKEEPQQLRDAYVAATAATWELLAPAVELSDRGQAEVAGRAGRKIQVKQAPAARANPPEQLDHRKWRENRTITGVDGEIVLDADSGVPLAVKLAGTVGFTRDNRRFEMKLTVDAKITKIGAAAIAAPPAEEVVATPQRLKEVDERDFLLKGIAPPLKKGSDLVVPGAGSAPVPTPPVAGKTPDKKVEKTPDKKVEKAPDKNVEKTPDKKVEKTPDKKVEKTPDKNVEKTPDAPKARPGFCASATLGREVEQGTCVQSGNNGKWYQCTDGKWINRDSSDGCPATIPAPGKAEVTP